MTRSDSSVVPFLVPRCKVWLTCVERRRCSNEAKSRNPLKFDGVPQTPRPISATSGRKFIILWGLVEEILLFNIFVRLSIHVLLWPPSVADADITPCLKKRPTFACYNFDTHEWILIFLAKMLPMKLTIKRRFTMPPQITYASALLAKRGNTKITFFTQLDCVTRTMHLCAVLLKEKLSLWCVW